MAKSKSYRELKKMNAQRRILKLLRILLNPDNSRLKKADIASSLNEEASTISRDIKLFEEENFLSLGEGGLKLLPSLVELGRLVVNIKLNEEEEKK